MMAGQPTDIGDTAVAIHSFGGGSIAYFGDVKCEARTAELIANYVRLRAPADPVTCDVTPLRTFRMSPTNLNDYLDARASDETIYDDGFGNESPIGSILTLTLPLPNPNPNPAPTHKPNPNLNPHPDPNPNLSPNLSPHSQDLITKLDPASTRTTQRRH